MALFNWQIVSRVEAEVKEKLEKKNDKRKSYGAGHKPYQPRPQVPQMPFGWPFGQLFGQMPFGQLGSGSQARTAGPNSECYNCRVKGHFSRDCPMKPAAQGAPK